MSDNPKHGEPGHRCLGFDAFEFAIPKPKNDAERKARIDSIMAEMPWVMIGFEDAPMPEGFEGSVGIKMAMASGNGPASSAECLAMLEAGAAMLRAMGTTTEGLLEDE